VKTFQGQPIVVLGMGRSGTSVLAQLLHTEGVSLYRQPVPQSDINPRGFNEEAAIVAFHQKLKKQFYSRFENDPDYDSALVDEVRQLDYGDEILSEATALLAGLEGRDFWGWKDPRSVLFIDLWLSLLPNAVLVAPFRHPLDILDSYLRRIPERRLFSRPDQVFRSYAAYNRKIIDIVTRRSNLSYVFYAPAGYRTLDKLARRLRQFLGIREPAAVSQDIFFADEFADPGISLPEHQLFSTLFPDAAACFDQLNCIADICFEPTQNSSDAIRELTVLASSGALTLSQEEWVPLLVRARGLDRLGYFGHARQCWNQLEVADRWLQSQVESYARAVDEQNQQIHEQEQLLQEKEQRIRNLEHQIQELEHQIQDLERWIRELQASWSWRVTAPLRALARNAGRP
jgi:hypothetical protein